MKRLLCIILAMIFMVICCSCRDNQLEKSIKKAEKYLEDCTIAGCKYGGEFDADDGIYRVVAVVPEQYNTNDSNECAVMNAVGNKIQDNVVPKLADIFSNVGTPVHIRIYDPDGTPHIEFKSKNRTHLCYED